MAARSLGRMYDEDKPSDFGGQLRDAIRFGDRTLEDMLEAQKRALETIRPLVRPDVWRTALALAGGDQRRIMIFSPEDVFVVNNPGERPAWLVESIIDKELQE